MSGEAPWRQPQNTEYVIDLTESDDLPVNPLAVRSPPRRKRSAREVELNADADLDGDIEVIDVRSSRRPSHAFDAPSGRRRSTAALGREDDLDVVSEKRLTPQERLRQIQAQHARGEIVRTNQPPLSQDELFNPYLARRRFLRSPEGYHPYLRPPQHHGIPFEFFSPYIFVHQNHQANLEQQIFERTLESSMDEMYHDKRPNAQSLIKPPPPAPARPGYTRALDAEEELVCVKCRCPLGVPREALSPAGRAQSQKIFVRGCGHVYCGQCTFAMRDRLNKDKKCPEEACKKLPARKRSLFREVFL